MSRWYGGLMNRLGENVKSPEPVVGMGVTLFHYSDRSAGTIRKVSKSGKTLWFTDDIAELVSGSMMSESQVYKFTMASDGARLIKATLRKNGTWKVSGSGTGMVLGHREAYRDPSF